MSYQDSRKIGDVKIVMLKGEKGEKGNGSYDDTEIRGLISDEVTARERADADIINQIGSLSYYVTPQMYGAQADGSADDTLAIQTAIDSGFPVIIPKGTYKITDSLDINQKISLFSFGNIISYASSPCFVFKDADFSDVYIASIEQNNKQNDLKLTDYNFRVGVVIDSCEQLSIVIDHVKDFTVGVILCSTSGGCYYNNITVNYCDGCLEGMHIVGYGNDSYVNGNNIKKFNYQFHSWSDSTDTPYMFRAYPVNNTYTNNANVFEHCIFENGVSGLTYKPKLFKAQYIHGFYMYFDRIECTESTISGAFDFDSNCRAGIMHILYSLSKLDIITTGRTNMIIYERSMQNNGSNMYDIKNEVTFGENVIEYNDRFTSFRYDRLNYNVAINVDLVFSANLATETTIFSGLPASEKAQFFACPGKEHGLTTDTPDTMFLFYMDRTGVIKNITPIYADSKIHFSVNYNFYV